MMQKRIESLTSLRFFMIMTIVISHLEFGVALMKMLLSSARTTSKRD